MVKDGIVLGKRYEVLSKIGAGGMADVYKGKDTMLNRYCLLYTSIPEIALTYQTVMRFYARFGNRVSILNSRLSQGERSDQMERVRRGEVDVMIGPRSALFTPFSNLGLIVIDEEHEPTYKSEQVPRYHARETAIPVSYTHLDVYKRQA